jgi:hypothetical protein
MLPTSTLSGQASAFVPLIASILSTQKIKAEGRDASRNLRRRNKSSGT